MATISKELQHDFIRRGWGYSQYIEGCRGRKLKPRSTQKRYNALYEKYWKQFEKRQMKWRTQEQRK